jgi:O-antigen/teichoic acid export membrane protein
VDVALYLPIIVVGAYFPGIARLWGRRRQLSGYLTWVSDRLILLAGIVACGGILFGEVVLRILGGDEYGGLGLIVALLMTALALMFMNLLFLEVLLAGRALAVRLLSYVAALIATFGVGLPLILILGAEGAAIGKLVTEVVLVLTAGWAVYSRSGWLPPLVPSALAIGGTLVATAVATTTGSLAVRIPVALVLAGIAAYVMIPRLRRTPEEEQPA